MTDPLTDRLTEAFDREEEALRKGVVPVSADEMARRAREQSTSVQPGPPSPIAEIIARDAELAEATDEAGRRARDTFRLAVFLDLVDEIERLQTSGVAAAHLVLDAVAKIQERDREIERLREAGQRLHDVGSGEWVIERTNAATRRTIHYHGHQSEWQEAAELWRAALTESEP